MGQSFSPYSDFLNMSPSQLTTLQGKLTFVGPQEEPVPSVGFTSTSNTMNLSLFVPFQRAGFSYQNDTLQVRLFTASTAQLQAMLQNAGLIPAVQAGGVGNPPYVSFSLVNTVPGTKGYEAILSPADGISLLNAFRNALAGNSDALTALNDFGCSTALRDPGVPADVSATVQVTLSGVRLVRSTGRYAATATLKNNGASAVALPISLVLTLPQGVTLFTTNGSTCGVSPVGLPFVNAPVSGPLQPGATIQINLEFINPNGVPIVAPTKVLAGPGGR